MRFRTMAAVAAVSAIAVTGLSVGLATAGDDPTVQTPSQASASTADASPAAVIGNSEPSFVPVDPCRIADTRAAGGIIVPGSARSFEVRGTTGFVPQGGKSGGCGIPDSATAVEMTVHAVSTAAKGFLRAFPFGGTPSATTVTYPGGIDLSNTGALPLCVSGCTKDLSIRSFLNGSHVVLDVVGYYAPPMWATVNEDGTLADGSRVVSQAKVGTGTYEVIFDRNLTECAYTATSRVATVSDGDNMVSVDARLGNANGVFVWVETDGGATEDAPFYVAVHC
jgi:hypothetical protein